MNEWTKQLPASQQALLADYQLSWREIGQGNPVVFLHGISSSAASWVKQLAAEQLYRHYRLLAWDAPGYQQSQPLATHQPSAKDYAQALERWLTGLSLNRVVLVGHSLGAIMASAYSALYPHKLTGLVLVDPAQGYRHASEQQRQTIYQSRVDAMTQMGPFAYAQQRAAALLSPQTLPENVQWVKQSMQQLNPTGFLAAAWLLANEDISQYLTDYRGPLMLINGEQDTITPLAQVDKLAKRLGKSITILPNAGHASYLDAPALFNQTLSDFLQKIVN